MIEKTDKLIKIVESINKTIDYLLEQGGIAISPIEGDVPVKKQKFIVVEDGSTIENTETEYYIELSDAKEYDSSVKVGDEIEIEVLDFDASDDDGILSVLSSDQISTEDLEKIVLGRRTTIKVAGRVIKYGPRTLKRMGRLAKKAIDAKRYVGRYGKKAEHSLCYCLTFTKDGLNEDGDTDKDIFESTIFDQPEFIQENLLNTWKFCHKKYGKSISKKDDRQDTQKSCIFLGDWYKKSENLLDDMIQQLKQAYEITGYDKKLGDDTKKVGGEQTVGEKIASQDYIEIKFSTDTTIGENRGSIASVPPGTAFFKSNELVTFKIQKTFNERNNTLLLKKGGKYYVMGFETTKIGEPQSDRYFAIYNNTSDTIENPKGTWSGKIMSYPN